MTAYWIVAAITCALAVSALVRVAFMQAVTARGRSTSREFERRVNEQALEATIAGTRLGTGRKVVHTYEIESRGFELVLASGERVTVAAGARVDYIGRSARLGGTEVTVPDGTRVRFLRPDTTAEGGPHKSPGALAFTRGDAVLLFEPGSRILLLPTRMRRTSIPRMMVLAGGTAALVVLCGVYGPQTNWNGLLFLELVALFIDQVIAKGLVSWILCTRAPPPLEL